MVTQTADVVELFLDKMESSPEFFSYYGTDDVESLALAKERGQSYLRGAIVEFRRRADLTFVLGIKTGTGAFQEPLTEDEADILSEIMVYKYFERKLVEVTPKLNLLSATEIRFLFSPSNERTSFNEMLEKRKEHLREIISLYNGRDRLTGERRMVDHTIPEDVNT